MKQLTKAEEEIMQILWHLSEGTIKDVLNGFSNKKPAYNTVATVLKVLKNRSLLILKRKDQLNIYYPLVSKENYTSFQIKGLLKNYFNGSFPRMATLKIQFY